MNPTSPTIIVYVSCAGTREVLSYRMDATTGGLAPLGGVKLPGPDPMPAISMPLAISPDKRFLYAAQRSLPFSISSFSIDPNSGHLALNATTPLVGSMSYLTISQNGRHLLSASFPQALLASNPIHSDGSVEERPTQIVPGQPEAHCILLHPDNCFAYAGVLGVDAIAQFRFDPLNGRLTENEPARVASEPFAGPRHLIFHPSLRILYSLNEKSGAVDVLAWDHETGLLSQLQTIDSAEPDEVARWREHKGEGPAHPPPGSLFDPRTAGAADIRVEPAGRHLYVSLRTSSRLVGFAIDPASGLLGQRRSWATEPVPRCFAIDFTGKFLIAAGQQSGTLAVSRIDHESGDLNMLHRYATHPNPNWIEIVHL